MYLCVCAHGGLRPASGIFLHHSQSHVLRHGLSLRPVLAIKVNLVSWLALGKFTVGLPFCSGVTGKLSRLPGLYIGFRDMNSGPHACGTSALSAEPSGRLPTLLLLFLR